MSSVLERLRQATCDRHHALDDRVSARMPFSRDDYVTFLEASRRVVAPLERALAGIAAYGEAVRFVERRRRAHLLDRDLASLAAAVTLVDLATPDVGVDVRSVDEAFGVAYVLEGSTLGGATIARTLTPALAASSSYLRAYGDELGPMWRAWVEDLERFAAQRPPSSHDAMVDAACATFDAFARAMGAFTPRAPRPAAPR